MAGTCRTGPAQVEALVRRVVVAVGSGGRSRAGGLELRGHGRAGRFALASRGAARPYTCNGGYLAARLHDDSTGRDRV